MPYDYICVFFCLDCKRYWTSGPSKRVMRCDHCRSKERKQTASIDAHVWLPRLLNGEASVDELKEWKEDK